MATRFHGLPGDQELVRRGFEKKFEEVFGRNANAKELYVADPCFFRFARLFPRPAYLLGHLQNFDRDLRRALNIFVQEFCRSKVSAIVIGQQAPFEDPFSFFHAAYDYSCCLLHLRAALVVNGRSTGALAYEVAQDVLDIVDNPDRQDIVNELLSADLATELDKRASHTGEIGFWSVRRVIDHTEAILVSNARSIRNRLEHGDEKAANECYNCCGKRVLASRPKRTLSPFGRGRSLTPSSSTFDGPDTEENEELLSATKKRRFN